MGLVWVELSDLTGAHGTHYWGMVSGGALAAHRSRQLSEGRHDAWAMSVIMGAPARSDAGPSDDLVGDRACSWC